MNTCAPTLRYIGKYLMCAISLKLIVNDMDNGDSFG